MEAISSALEACNVTLMDTRALVRLVGTWLDGERAALLASLEAPLSEAQETALIELAKSGLVQGGSACATWIIRCGLPRLIRGFQQGFGQLGVIVTAPLRPLWLLEAALHSCKAVLAALGSFDSIEEGETQTRARVSSARKASYQAEPCGWPQKVVKCSKS
jgi:hypothetical protein